MPWPILGRRIYTGSNHDRVLSTRASLPCGTPLILWAQPHLESASAGSLGTMLFFTDATPQPLLDMVARSESESFAAAMNAKLQSMHERPCHLAITNPATETVLAEYAEELDLELDEDDPARTLQSSERLQRLVKIMGHDGFIGRARKGLGLEVAQGHKTGRASFYGVFSHAQALWLGGDDLQIALRRIAESRPPVARIRNQHPSRSRRGTVAA